MNIIRPFILTLMLLTLVGQSAFAAAMSAAMASMPSTVASPVDIASEHSSHCGDMGMEGADIASADNDSNSPKFDCCSDNCSNCVMASSSLVLLHNLALSPAYIYPMSHSSLILAAPQSRYSASLYRPPIAR